MEKEIEKIVSMNIIFPIQGEEVLLAVKTRKIGVGLFNGYGGKLDENETKQQACARELFTESGLNANPEDFQLIGLVDFYIHKNDGKITVNSCEIYTVKKFTGSPKPTVEMINPTWFPISKLPLNKMMEDATFWVPRMLNGERIKVQIDYNEERTKIIQSIHSEKMTLN